MSGEQAVAVLRTGKNGRGAAVLLPPAPSFTTQLPPKVRLLYLFLRHTCAGLFGNTSMFAAYQFSALTGAHRISSDAWLRELVYFGYAEQLYGSQKNVESYRLRPLADNDIRATDADRLTLSLAAYDPWIDREYDEALPAENREYYVNNHYDARVDEVYRWTGTPRSIDGRRTHPVRFVGVPRGFVKTHPPDERRDEVEARQLVLTKAKLVDYQTADAAYYEIPGALQPDPAHSALVRELCLPVSGKRIRRRG